MGVTRKMGGSRRCRRKKRFDRRKKKEERKIREERTRQKRRSFRVEQNDRSVVGGIYNFSTFADTESLLVAWVIATKLHLFSYIYRV